MKKLLIENLSQNLTLMEKVEYEAVEMVFHSLLDSFHPEGYPEEDFDVRFSALWNLYLITAGWSEEDFWEEFDFHIEMCDKCKKEKEVQENLAKEKN